MPDSTQKLSSNLEENWVQVNKKVAKHRKANRGVQTELNTLLFPVLMIIIMQMQIIVFFRHDQGERKKKNSQSPKCSSFTDVRKLSIA